MLGSSIKLRRKPAAPKAKMTVQNEKIDGEEDIGEIEDESERSDDEDEEPPGYNLEILSPKDVEWANKGRCIALNMNRFESDGIGKAFISGRGRPDNLGGFLIMTRGIDVETSDVYHDWADNRYGLEEQDKDFCFTRPWIPGVMRTNRNSWRRG